MRRPLGIAILLGAVFATTGRTASLPSDLTANPGSAPVPVYGPAGPHAAVVRVVVPQRDGTSFGSGTLVGCNQQYGLVVTNWHVVRDAAGPIVVVFVDGFRSGARLLKTDRDWDLAALAIWRPNVQPVPLSAFAPQPGEPLTIAGYGNGSYRTATGRCVQYVSPGGILPYEMVELSAAARDGDSGGPIFNGRGELAGVLFGSAFGRTTGSYSGRVGAFLTSVLDDFQRLDPNPTMIARQPAPGPVAPDNQPYANPSGPGRESSSGPVPSSGSVASSYGSVPVAAIGAGQTPHQTGPASESSPVPEIAQLPAASGDRLAEDASESTQVLTWSDLAGPTLGAQVKTILALIGLVTVLIQGVRLLGAVHGAGNPAS